MGRKNSHKYYPSEDKIQMSINHAKSGEKKICIFGAGKIGTGVGFEYVKRMGLHIDCYCDNNKNLWETIINENIKCISINEFLKRKEEFICFVMVGGFDIKEICEQLYDLGVTDIVPFDSRQVIGYLRKDFYPFDVNKNMCYPKDNTVNSRFGVVRNSGERIAVYTCIVGEFDQIKEPKFQSQDCDYFLISDKKVDSLKVFKWLDINLFLPEDIEDNRRKNRYCKLHPHKIFKDYQYSIYMDGSIQILGDITEYVNKIGISGIATFEHMKIGSLYDEGISCIYNRQDDPAVVMKQIMEYWEKGMPCDFGHRECGLLTRKHNNMNCILIMEDWWQEIKTKSCRDQLSFTYAVWKNGFQLSDIGVLGNDLRELEELQLSKHIDRG